MSYKIRNPQNRPDEVSIIKASGGWKVFVRRKGIFDVQTFEKEGQALAFAETQRRHLKVREVARLDIVNPSIQFL